MSSELNKVKFQLDSTKNKFSNLQQNYVKGLNELLAAKEKAENSYKETQVLTKVKQELETKYNQSQEELTNAQTQIENFKKQISELNDKYSNDINKNTF